MASRGVDISGRDPGGIGLETFPPAKSWVCPDCRATLYGQQDYPPICKCKKESI